MKTEVIERLSGIVRAAKFIETEVDGVSLYGPMLRKLADETDAELAAIREENARLREACGIVCQCYCDWYSNGSSSQAAAEFYDCVSVIRAALSGEPSGKVSVDNKCQLSVEPMYQCCCNCENHIRDLWHCSTQGGDVNHDLCYEPRGWICVMPSEDPEGFSGWAEHSCGCEMYTPKDGRKADNTRVAALRERAVVAAPAEPGEEESDED